MFEGNDSEDPDGLPDLFYVPLRPRSTDPVALNEQPANKGFVTQWRPATSQRGALG